MTARRKARKRALDVLFEAEQRGVDALTLLAERALAAEPPMAPYTVVLVEGVVANRAEIDTLLVAHLSEDWSLPRLPAVDRGLLRIACYELRFAAEPVPAGVAIDEAVGLAQDLSTDDSPRFINGVLGAIAALPILST